MNYFNNPSVKKARIYINFLMAIAYLTFGVLFLTTEIGIEGFPMYRTQIGLVLISYSIFRFYTSIKKRTE